MNNQSTIYWDPTAGRHNGGSNFLFADGHVKWFLGDKVSAGGPPTAANCQQDGQGCLSTPNTAVDSQAGSGNAAGTAALGNGNGWAVTFSPI